MIIHLMPQAPEGRTVLRREGQRLIYNGRSIDFAGLPEGAVAERGAVAADEVIGRPSREGGAVRLALIWPAPEGTPSTTIVLEDGQTYPAGAEMPPAGPPIATDWTRVETAAARAEAERRAKERAVTAERARRIEGGAMIPTPTGGQAYVTGTMEDRVNVLGLTVGALIATMAGEGETQEVTYRDGANDHHTMTASQFVRFFVAASTYVSDLYSVSWQIKASAALPDDPTDDTLWPDGGSQ